jgi:hypothetical protein
VRTDRLEQAVWQQIGIVVQMGGGANSSRERPGG